MKPRHQMKSAKPHTVIWASALLCTSLSYGQLEIETIVDPDNPTLNRPYTTERVVLPGNTQDLSLQAFAFRNTGDDDVSYTYESTGFSTTSDIGAGFVFGTDADPAGGVSTITARPDFAVDAVPGTTVNASMVIKSADGTQTLLDFGNYTMTGIVNRAITGSVDIDAGRFVRSMTTSSSSTQYSIGTLTLDGGALADDEGTRVDTTGDYFSFNRTARLFNTDAHSNTYDSRLPYWSTVRSNELSSEGQGLRLVGQSPNLVEFRAADVTTDYNIQFSSSGVKDVQLSGADFRLMFDEVEESLRNVEMDLSGIDVAITGTALTNRTFRLQEDGGSERSSFYVDKGRAMVGTVEDPYTGSVNLSVNSSGSDDEYTRVLLGTGSTTQNGVTLTTSEDTEFRGPTSASMVMDYNVTFDSSTSGRKTHSANTQALMSSAEENGPLANQTLLSNFAGVQKTFVEDRVVEANDVTIQALTGTGSISQISNRIFSHGHDDDNTRVKVDGQDMQRSWWNHSYYYHDDSFSVTPVTSATPTTPQFGGTRTLDITPEGLDGENAQASVSYDWYTQFLDTASVSFQENEGSTDFSNPTEVDIGDRIRYSFTTGSDVAEVDNYYSRLRLSGPRTIALSGTMDENGGNVEIVERTGEALLGGTYTTRIRGDFSHDLSILGATVGDIGSYYWEYELEIPRPVAPFAFMEATAGVRLQGAGLTNEAATFADPTKVDILDTNPLSDDITLEISFDAVTSAEGEDAETLVSDIVNITGLGGELFVMQMNFDRQTAIDRFGSVSAATLLWYDPDENIWRNAIEGNSDDGAGASRFGMSYDDYLLSQGGDPTLSHFGIDLVNDSVWAVLDHNSSFAASAIPEIGSVWMLLLVGGTWGVVRAVSVVRKQKRK